MSFESRMTKSIWGREFGLQSLSSVQLGSTFPHNLLVGAEGLRQNVTSNETTGVPLRPFGVSNLSTVSSGVHVLSPPIPGITKTIVCTGGATEFVKSLNAETFESSRGSTFTTLRFVAYGIAEMVGLTTARWLLTGMAGDSGDSANAPAITLSTST